MKTFILLSMISVLMMLPDTIYAQNSSNLEKVTVDLSPNQPVHKLFPLTLLSIDGKPVARKDHQIMIEAGQHTLRFSTNIDFRYLTASDRILRNQVNQRTYQDSLTFNFETGKRYQLAFDARPDRVEDWKPIVLHTTEQ